LYSVLISPICALCTIDPDLLDLMALIIRDEDYGPIFLMFLNYLFVYLNELVDIIFH
jgi:hypothetical protein